jgi:LPS-assembly lipoprotein
MTRRASLLLFAALALAGCGFHPAYMPTAAGEAGVAQREMAAVFVETIGERSGQLLRQALQERFERNGTGVQRRYSLAVNYGISGEGVAVTPDSLVTRIRVGGVPALRLGTPERWTATTCSTSNTSSATSATKTPRSGWRTRWRIRSPSRLPAGSGTIRLPWRLNNGPPP